MEQFIGCDAHKKFSVFVAVNEKGQAGEAIRVEHDRRLYREFLSQLPKQSLIAVEASGHYGWLVDEMEQFGHCPRLANPLSNHRLIAFENDQVTFRWKDYAHRNKKRKMTVSADEFLRRFLLHVLPRGFVRIRFFGFLANRRRADLLPLCRQLLAQQATESAQSNASTEPAFGPCPKCSIPMLLVERLSVTALAALHSQRSYLDTS
jgi:transposase